jgi:hypothetical protein
MKTTERGRKETMFETSLTQDQIRAHEVSAHQFVRGDSIDCAIVHLTGDIKTIDGMSTFRISMLDVSGRSYNVVLHPDDLRALADAVAIRPTESDSAIASDLDQPGQSDTTLHETIEGETGVNETSQGETAGTGRVDDATVEVGLEVDMEEDLSEDSWDFEQVIVSRPQSDLEAEAWSDADPWADDLPNGLDQKTDYDRWLSAWDDAAA